MTKVDPHYEKQYTVELPVIEYWVFWHTAINKRFFKWWTPFIFFSGVAVTAIALLTDWWQTLAILTLTFFYVQYWYIGWPATLIGGVILAYMYNRRQKRIRQERYARLQALRAQQLINAAYNKAEVNIKNEKKH